MARTSLAPGSHQFPCGQCGALLTFSPGTEQLDCAYCGHLSLIERTPAVIREFDFREALRELTHAGPADERITTQCESCAAEFDFETNVHSGECPFCGTAIVTGTGANKHIKPKTLLPFRITTAEAAQSYRRWLQGLWFAPGKLKRHAREEQTLNGVYVPYWTYDSATTTRYHGQRGDAYTVPESYTVVVDGRRVRRTRMVTRIRWTPVSGTVSRFFDDVLVGASRSLPRQITRRLQPWDLENLVNYDEKYLSGFRSEVYQVALDEGFQIAIDIMDGVIRGDIARDIGGDQQRITSLSTQRHNTTFKHLLLPVWSAAFRYRGKVYRFVVNGRTGKVQGERPYSIVKIAAAVLAGATLAAGLFVVLDETGILQEILRNL